MPIPDKPKVPQVDVGRLKILLYGVPKIGKSTFASQVPDSIVLATDPGWNSLPGLLWQDANGSDLVTSWEMLMAATREVVDAKRFKTIVLDTVDQAIALCGDFFCRKFGVEFENDDKLSWGKGRKLITRELRRYLMGLTALNMGYVLISHAADETVEVRGGQAYTRIVPGIPDTPKKEITPRQVVCGVCDLILYATIESQEVNGQKQGVRVMKTKPHWAYEAGDRTGRLPETMPLDYPSLVAAFGGPQQPRKGAAK